METLVIRVAPEKKDFFLSLMKEFSFVEIEDFEEDSTWKAIQESEEDIKAGRVIPHSQIQKEIQEWRQK